MTEQRKTVYFNMIVAITAGLVSGGISAAAATYVKTDVIAARLEERTADRLRQVAELKHVDTEINARIDRLEARVDAKLDRILARMERR